MQVNGGSQRQPVCAEFETLKNVVTETTAALTLFAACSASIPSFAGTLGMVMRSALRSSRPRQSACVAIASSFGPWRLRLHQSRTIRPEYVEIDTSETGFLIPLEGDCD